MSHSVIPRWALILIAPPLLIWAYFSALAKEMWSSHRYAWRRVRLNTDALKREWNMPRGAGK